MLLETKDLINATMSLLEEYHSAHDSSVEPATLPDDIIEEFLDEVFDTESRLEREEFVESVAKNQAWIFDPNKVRERLGYTKAV